MTKLVSTERLEGIITGLRFGLENGVVEIEDKLQEAESELVSRKKHPSNSFEQMLVQKDLLQ